MRQVFTKIQELFLLITTAFRVHTKLLSKSSILGNAQNICFKTNKIIFSVTYFKGFWCKNFIFLLVWYITKFHKNFSKVVYFQFFLPLKHKVKLISFRPEIECMLKQYNSLHGLIVHNAWKFPSTKFCSNIGKLIGKMTQHTSPF